MAVLIDLHSPASASLFVGCMEIITGLLSLFFFYEWYHPDRAQREAFKEMIVDQCKCHLVEDNADTPADKQTKSCGSKSCTSPQTGSSSFSAAGVSDGTSTAQNAASTMTATAGTTSATSAKTALSKHSRSRDAVKFEVIRGEDLPKRTDSEIKRFGAERDKFEAGVVDTMLKHYSKQGTEGAQSETGATQPTQGSNSSDKEKKI
ncbi:unnamed protein product, partial [Mesorhabditis spiculigera]